MTTLAKTDAVKLDKEIRATIGAIWDNMDRLTLLIQQAIDGQAHLALGYPSTKAYLKDVLAEQPKLGSRKDREQRNQIIALLRGSGSLTQKDIGTILGISQKTVDRALKSNDLTGQPDTVIGADGKTYPTTKKKRQPVVTESSDDTSEIIEGEIVDEEIFYNTDDTDDDEQPTPEDHIADTNRLIMKLDRAKQILIDALKITQNLQQYDATIKATVDNWIPELRDILIAIEATAVGTDIEEGLKALLAEGN